MPLKIQTNPEDKDNSCSIKQKRRNIVSPWENVGEFQEVTKLIYGENSNATSWERAIKHMVIWMNRRRAQCPAAVFATHAMLSVKLTDERNKHSDADLQSLYAFALIRFFNFMSSTIQTHNMRSMYNTAIEMGLASFVVDIRHICAHGTELPELKMLRQVADYCLNWLRSYYWLVQTEKMIDAEAKNLVKRDKNFKKQTNDLKELLLIFDLAFECHLNNCVTKKDLKTRLQGHRMAKFKNYWKLKNLNSVREVFNEIVLDMIVVAKTGIPHKSLAAIFASQIVKLQYFLGFLQHHNIACELEHILDVVQNFFRFLAVYNCIEPILYKLCEFAESENTSVEQKDGAVFWIQHIIAGFTTFMRCKKKYIGTSDESNVKLEFKIFEMSELSKNLRQTYIYNGVDVKRTIIFGDSFQRPWVWHFSRQFLEKRVKAVNEHTAPVLMSLTPLIKPKMTTDEINNLNKVIETYINENEIEENDGKPNENNDASDKVYTLEDLFSISNCGLEDNTTNNMVTDSNDETNKWTSTNGDEYDWSKCPIGRLPW